VKSRTILGAVGALILTAAPAAAQKDLFVAGVRELAAAVVATDPARSPRIQAAVDRMAAALAEWDRAITAIDGRIARDLEHARGQRAYELHLELAVTYLERGRLAEALRHLEMASAAEPAAADAQVLRAVVLELSGRRDAAATLWHSVWRLDRSNPVKAYQVLRAGGGQPEERTAAANVMRAAYERLLAKDEPARPLSIVALDIIPDTFSAAPIVGDAATGEGFAALAEARYDEALAALRRGAVAGEEAPRARFERAQEFEKANRVREARREYEAAVAGTLSGRSLLYTGIGRLAQVEGDVAGAIDAFTRAVQLTPDNVNMHRELAFAYASQGAIDEAFTELAASLLLNPRDAQTFADIGRLFLDSGRDADALPPLNRALRLAPERFETRYAIATALTRLGRADEAARELAAFERAQREALDRQRRGLATPGPGSSR
jgi:tetratricopeptide (TPR) repeat protein